MKYKVTTMIAAAAMVLNVAAAPPAQSTTNPATLNQMTIASVNGEPVTVKEVLEVFNDRHSGHSKFLGGDVELRKFLSIVLDDKLLVQEAYDIGLDQDPSVVEAAAQAEKNRVVAALVREELEVKSRPTPEDVKKVWESLDTVRQVQQVTLPNREDAEQVRAAILQGADINYFARNCSISRSRLNGGHLMVMWGNMTDEWEAVVFPLEPGEIAPVVATPEGYDVVLVENKVSVPRPDFEKSREEIESAIYKRRLERRKSDYAVMLADRYHVVRKELPSTAKDLLKLLVKAPDTAVATWDGGGKVTIADCFSVDDLNRISTLADPVAKSEIEKQIQMTINEPLVALDGKERKIGERPEIAEEVTKIREYTMEAVLYRDHVFKSLDVKDEEILAYYNEHQGEFEAPEQRRVAQILVATEKEASAIREKLVNGADFAAMAKERSRDFVSAEKGGELGWITAANIPPSFSEIGSLAAGKLAKPIHDSGGWHLIKVLEVKPKQTRAFSEVRDLVKAKVTDDRKRALRAAWVDKLRGVSKIQVDDAAIKAFVAANQFDEKAAPPQHAIQ